MNWYAILFMDLLIGSGPTRRNVPLMHRRQEWDMMGYTELRSVGAKLESK